MHTLTRYSTASKFQQPQLCMHQTHVTIHTLYLFKIKFVVFFQLLILLLVEQHLVLLQQQLNWQWNGFRTCPLQRWPTHTRHRQFVQTVCFLQQLQKPITEKPQPFQQSYSSKNRMKTTTFYDVYLYSSHSFAPSRCNLQNQIHFFNHWHSNLHPHIPACWWCSHSPSS